MQDPKGRDQVSVGVSVPCRHVTPVADALWKPIYSNSVKVWKKSSQGKVSLTGVMYDCVSVVSTKEHLQIPYGTGPGVRGSKRPLSACHTRRKCSMVLSNTVSWSRWRIEFLFELTVFFHSRLFHRVVNYTLYAWNVSQRRYQYLDGSTHLHSVIQASSQSLKSPVNSASLKNSVTVLLWLMMDRPGLRGTLSCVLLTVYLSC